MNDITRDITAVLMAVVGVAILAVIVSNRSNTSQVIQTASNGFGHILGVAMGGAGNAPVMTGA
jgi:hypothetical protein